MPKGLSREAEQKWNLLAAGQDTYAGQNAQDPRTSRKVQSWIVQDDGQLHRELQEPQYASNQLPGPIVGLYEFDQNNGQGGVVRNYYCAARVNSTVGTQNCLFYSYVGGAWATVTTVGTLANAPMCVVQENNFFLDDGVSNWLYNGTIWVQNGINFPLNPPAINVLSGNTTTSGQVYISNTPITSQNGIVVPAGVTCTFYNQINSSFNGTAWIEYPNTLTALDSASNSVNPTLLFNSPQVSGGNPDPPVAPMIWAEIPAGATNGIVTGTQALPYPANNDTTYQMSVICSLVIPAAGSYKVGLQHDDGCYFGLGTGAQGNVPTGAAGGLNAPATTGNLGLPTFGGHNYSGFTSALSDVYVVSFPAADTYPLEINYVNWNDGPQQTLIFSIVNQSSGNNASAIIPLQVGSSSSAINASIGRNYWFDNADQTVGVATESSSSPITPQSTGPVINGSVAVYQQPGLYSSSISHVTVTGSNSTDSPGPVNPQLNGSMVGQAVYLSAAGAATSTFIGIIASVGTNSTLTTAISQMKITSVVAPDLTTLANGLSEYLQVYNYSYTPPDGTKYSPPGANNLLAGVVVTATGFTNPSNNFNAAIYSSTGSSITVVNQGVAETGDSVVPTVAANIITLVTNAAASITNGRAVICDKRCTHWNVYASESDGSQIGEYLFSVPVTRNLTSTAYVDSSPFIDNANNTFLPIYRPVRNDRPCASKLLYVHKSRQFRRVESNPSFFAFTANEEVTAGNNGDPAQCLPGASPVTVSDMVNEYPFPDQSVRLRALFSHMDALYMFSEKQCYPLYGQSVDDFAISQMVTFALGAAGRFAGVSTPNGLIFMSYDKRAFLYPTSLYSTYLAQGGAAQSAISEIGKPMRNVFAQIPASRLDEVVSVYYHYGIRDWWVVSFPTSTTVDAPQTYVWDFQGKVWFQLQRGFSSLQVFEPSEGALVLIGGDALGNTWVIDDQTGTYSYTGNLPVATWQPALINFGNEEIAHVFRRLELEFSSEALAQDITATIWFDPLNVDSPGVGHFLPLKPALGPGRYSAMVPHQGAGTVCQRCLVQIQARASTNSGVIRGIKMYADVAPGFLSGSGRVGGV